MESGTEPELEPTPALSKRRIGRVVERVLIKRGSQKSIVPRKWVRKRRGGLMLVVVGELLMRR